MVEFMVILAAMRGLWLIHGCGGVYDCCYRRIGGSELVSIC